MTAHAASARVPSEGLAPLRAFLAAAVRPASVQGIAGTLGVHRRTLLTQCAAARIPAPQALSAWCRLLVAARLLDDPTHTIERVAHELGFGPANALRNLLQRHAKLSPTTLRAHGGYPYLRDRFVAQLAGAAAVGHRARAGRTRAGS